MPKTKLKNQELLDEKTQISQYHEALSKIRTKELAEWEKGFKGKNKYKQQKKQATLDLLGATYSEEEFAALEYNIEHMPGVKTLFEKIMNELSALQIGSYGPSYKNALIGNQTGLDKDAWQKEFDEVYTTVTLLSNTNKETKTLRPKDKAVESYAQKQFNDAYKSTMNVCTVNLADSKYDEKTGKDRLDEKHKENMVAYAAYLVSVQTEVVGKPIPTAEENGYDYDKISESCKRSFDEKKKEQRKLEEELKKMPEFAAFVAEQRAAGLTGADFKAEALTQSWEKFKERLYYKRTEYQAFMQDAALLQDPEQGREMAKDARMTYPNLLFVADTIDEEDGKLSKETIQEKCKNILSDKSNTGDYLSMDQFLLAANRIVADTLLSPAAEKTFYTDTKLLKDGEPDQKLVNKAFIEMRDQVINDPIFREVLVTRPETDKVVELYRKAVNKEINKKIKAEKADIARRKENTSLDSAFKKFGEEEAIAISEEEYKQILDAKKKLEQFNEGKKPSDHMKRLITALDNVIREYGKDGDNIKVNTLTELNSASLNYYNKRQGILFSPLTDNGKARYATVEKLTFVTDQINTRCKDEFSRTRVPQQQQKQMGK